MMEPHLFHDGEPCFPGCPAWDSKVGPVMVAGPEGGET